MRYRLVLSSLLLTALFLSLAPTALASTTWYVDGVNGSDNNNCKSPQTACKTIGHAISLASSGDSVMVAAATYKENLTIRLSLKIVGSGAKTAIIDGGLHGTVVTIPTANAHVTLSKLTIRNGVAVNGGGINSSGTLTINNSTISGNSAYGAGGGIYNLGTLTINNSSVSGNAVRGTYAFGGGIVSNNGTLTINDSTLSANSTNGTNPFDGESLGGGIFNTMGRLTINNSTLSGNTALAIKRTGRRIEAAGGGIYNFAGAALTINNSTLSGNGAKTDGGGIANPATGGATATLQNSIVANSPFGGNCGGTMTSKDYNLSDDGTCNFNGTGDLNNTDPKLGRLRNNGGPTQTMAELEGSPTIDAGNPGGCTDSQGHLLKTDQRGFPRPGKYKRDHRCDMGAYERQSD